MQPLRLRHLWPRWINTAANPSYFLPERNGLGLTFDCPGVCCSTRKSIFMWCAGDGEWKQRIGVYFTNPLDGLDLHPHVPTWARAGVTFETITLRPMIWCAEHWEGHVVDGAILDARRAPLYR